MGEQHEAFLATGYGALESLTELHRVAVRAMAEVEPSHWDELADLRRLTAELREQLDERYGVALPAPAAAKRVPELTEWTLDAEELVDDLASARFPFFQGARDRQQKDHLQRSSSVVAQALALLGKYRRETLDAVTGDGVVAAKGALVAAEDATARVRAAVATPPGSTAAITRQGVPRRDPGPVPLVFEVGTVRTDQLTLTVWPGGSGPLATSGRTVTLPVPDVEVPLLLDLDRLGGLVTDSAETVNALLLHALAVLPAGRVTFGLFDPQRLGESSSFLYALGDAAERIIGAKVRTTHAEIAELLLSLEQHITFVTQKYLQGQHASLTEYNVSAGDIAEPYRFLVLYDYPHGFWRSQHEDDEALARLRKIISAGPRCGVFTLVVDPGDYITSQPTTGSASAVRKLVHLRSGAPIAPPTIGALLNVPNAAAAAGAPCLAHSIPLADLRRPADDDGSFRASCGYSETATRTWTFHPVRLPDAVMQQRVLGEVERALARAEDVRVSPEQVAALYDARARRDAARDGEHPPPEFDFDVPGTWWCENSTEALAVAFARVGASDVGVLRLDSKVFSGALVGGRPGAGKSVFLHMVVTGLALRYSPAELELYLVDFKEGVEFKQYADLALPHARVVAIESEREFGLSVIEGLDREIARRGELFRGSGGAEADISAYRRGSGRPLPRIVLVIDEFHVLFDRDDRLAARAAELLDRIVRQGRAFGVHTILASQTIAGVAALGRHTLNQVPIRVALQSSDADSRLLLADDNADAQLLTRPGEGILNTKGGAKDANQRFQAAYLEPERRDELIRRLRERADAETFHRRPIVFEGNAAARIDAVPVAELAAILSAAVPTLPLGLPLSLDAPVVATLRREPGGNVLVVGDDEQASSLLALSVAVLAARRVACDIVDFGGGASFADVTAAVAAKDGVRVGRRRDLSARLAELAAEVEQRHALSDFAAPARCLVLAGLQRARELDAMGGEGSPGDAEALEAILRDGPDVGVHVVASFDKALSIGRRLASSAAREFGQRVLFKMSKEDSFSLIGSEVAALMNSAQGTFHDDDRSETMRFRPFTPPPPDWVTALVASGPPVGISDVG